MKGFIRYAILVATSALVGFTAGKSSVISNNLFANNVNSEIKAERGGDSIDHISPRNEYLDQFLINFFYDSAFQVTRIIFPLKATTPINHYDMDTTSVLENEWRFVSHERLLFVNRIGEVDCDCNSNVAIVDEGNMFNRITYDFKRLDGKWFLVSVFESAELHYQTFRGYHTH